MQTQIFMIFCMVIKYYLESLSFKFHAPVHAHLFTNLYIIWNSISKDSIWPPHKISWRSKLSLRRYLQNNTGVCLILNFQFILHIFPIWASKFLKNWKIFQIWKTTFVGRQPSVKDDLQWKRTLSGRRPSLDSCMLPTPLW